MCGWGWSEGKNNGKWIFFTHTHTQHEEEAHIYDISHCKLRKKIKSIKRTRNRTKVMMWTNWIIIVVVVVDIGCAKKRETAL